MNELPFEKLFRKCDPELLKSINHTQTSPLKTIIGQERAVRALKFGLGIKERDLTSMSQAGRVQAGSQQLSASWKKLPPKNRRHPTGVM